MVDRRSIAGRLPPQTGRFSENPRFCASAALTIMRSRVLSGMRPTGALHLGHYHGALKNWVRLQEEHDCFYFVADWHALTTHYDEREVIEQSVYEMVIDWIAPAWTCSTPPTSSAPTKPCTCSPKTAPDPPPP